MRDHDQKPNPGVPRKSAAPKTREERLKAALKANMARRKAQAKARGETASGPTKNNE